MSNRTWWNKFVDYLGFLRREEVLVGREDLRRISLLRSLLYLAVLLGTLVAAIVPGILIFSIARLSYSATNNPKITPTQVTNYLLGEVATLAAFSVSMWLLAMAVQLIVLWVQQRPGSHPFTTWLATGRRALVRSVTALGVALPYSMLAYYLSAKLLKAQATSPVVSDSAILADTSLLLAFLCFSIWILVEAAVAIWWLFRPGHARASVLALVATTGIALAVDQFQLFDKLTLQSTVSSGAAVREFLAGSGTDQFSRWLIWGFLALLPLGFLVRVGQQFLRHQRTANQSG